MEGGAGTGTDGGKPSLDWKNISRSRLSFGSVASGKSTMGTTRRLGGMGKPKKLLVSGLPVADAGAEEAIRTWCEVRRVFAARPVQHIRGLLTYLFVCVELW